MARDTDRSSSTRTTPLCLDTCAPSASECFSHAPVCQLAPQDEWRRRGGRSDGAQARLPSGREQQEQKPDLAAKLTYSRRLTGVGGLMRLGYLYPASILAT